MAIWIAYWFDREDRIMRVAGVYTKEAAAWRRVKKLSSGTVQKLRLNRAVIFTHETAESEQEKP
jgi:hypothetical protein